MKLPALLAVCLQLGTLFVAAGEPRLVLTYQPLDGQGSGEVEIHPVTAHDMFGHSHHPNALSLIAAANIPPNNSNLELEDHNMAHLAGIKISLDEDQSGKIIIQLDLTGLKIDQDFICTEKEIVGATLECMRRTSGEKLDKMKIQLKTKPEGQDELKKLVASFVKHPKKKPFRWKSEAPAQ